MRYTPVSLSLSLSLSLYIYMRKVMQDLHHQLKPVPEALNTHPLDSAGKEYCGEVEEQPLQSQPGSLLNP